MLVICERAIAQYMGALQEVEIFSCMRENLRLAAEHAADLALKPAQGPTYRAFREEMLLVEGCCKQASAWREDFRWLDMGLTVANYLKRTGRWLRGYKIRGQLGKVYTSRDLYLKLAEELRAAHRAIDILCNGATGRMGMILPDVPHVIRTEGRPVQVRTPGGIILPDAA